MFSGQDAGERGVHGDFARDLGLGVVFVRVGHDELAERLGGGGIVSPAQASDLERVLRCS